MKSVLLLVVALNSASQAANASVLVTSKWFSGYGPSPQIKTLTLSVSGEIALETKDMKSGAITTETLGHLTDAAMTKVVANISGITSETKLVDEEAGTPVCADGPSFSVTAIVANQPVEISRDAGCHHWRLENYQGQSAARLALSFTELR